MFAPRNNRSNKSTSRRGRTTSPVRGSRRPRTRDYAKARSNLVPRNQDSLFDAPENWHEPTGKTGFDVLKLNAGYEYRHVVSVSQVRDRLRRLPQRFLRGLEVVQLSTMTRKKRLMPCYGLQWGCAIYLYPFHRSMEEHFHSPPPQQLVIESRMYGGRWDHPEPNLWRLIWTETTARDYQLNNILVHELGHLVDTWNSNSADQERFAEWFAIEFGYLHSGGRRARRPWQKVKRRHHS